MKYRRKLNDLLDTVRAIRLEEGCDSRDLPSSTHLAIVFYNRFTKVLSGCNAHNCINAFVK